MARDIFQKSVARLSGIGPKKAKALENIGLYTVNDLLYYYPRRYLDRSTVQKISQLRNGMEATVIAKIVVKGIKRGRKNRFIVVVSDGTGNLECVWFSRLTYWQKIFNVGDWLALSGKIKYFGIKQITHPEFDRLNRDREGEFVHTGKIIPLYSSNDSLSKLGLDSRGFRRLFVTLFKNYKNSIIDFLPHDILTRLKFMDLADALENVHFPQDFPALYKARRRLKFDEMFLMELLIAFRKQQKVIQKGIRFDKVGSKVQSLIDHLPFELTDAQKKVLHEIRRDMKSDKPMNRLLQGDVGSGKTIVALITILIAIENGYQAALMAPTEILAEQHFLTTQKWFEQLGVKSVLLVGGQSKNERNDALDKINSEIAQVIIGTHALIQENVAFPKLGLVIIDEQHRFGVIQRGLLMEKGLKPDVLVMTATPIPRTLSLTVYGDLDVSVLDEQPKGRKTIKTYWRTENKRTKIYRFVRDQIDRGSQAYVVFPLVEETEKSDLKAATDSYTAMRDTFFSGYNLGLLHGRMKREEKEEMMQAFKSGDLHILVSTTVIEVGVDVPNATTMLIEHAERFGLTQLHQLRGRVGRGEKQSYCILVAYGDLSEDAKKRLDTMTQTSDGFKIAQVDLELRGPGEFFGTRQHGLPELKIADIVKDFDLLKVARKEAFNLLHNDPKLLRDEYSGIRNLFLHKYKHHISVPLVA